MVVHGDLHLPQVQRAYGYDGDAGVTGTGLRADWVSFYVAASNRWLRKVDDATVTLMEGRFHRGMDLMDRPPDIPLDSQADPQILEPSCGWLRVQGSTTPKLASFSMLISQDAEGLTFKERFRADFKVGSNRPYNQMCADRGMSLDIY
jgi:hypothetical protein